ncbi:hypothetical protein [Fimbriiglobus ruber]|uniref:FtsH ternary system domain-containing protein n=1 Tax=Fimbriiglobus ruber TaxID=1908690 RepID=A0A225D9E3_9BACT|nr:hypothetical protein [Fimbriiglobus ruber]OWK38082.1 hypothetical protein FRUB_07202 [Fimbriiglobus ruber]
MSITVELRPTPPDPPGPPAVSRFEYDLLRILRFLLGHMPAEQAKKAIETKYTAPPPCLSRTCVRLARDMMAKGLVLFLVRSGGWRRDRYLRGNQPVEGRVWDRLPLDERRLTFSRHALGFVFWLAADRATTPAEAWDAPAEELTPGDELFFALALDALRSPATQDTAAALSGKAAFARNPLCWLMHPADFATPDDPAPPAFDPCSTGTRAAILDCLQQYLAQRWVRGERAKGQIGDWKRMRQQGRAEAAALSAYLSAAERHARPDLARFILRAASVILGGGGEISPAFWTGGLHGSGPPRLADRLETQRAALALPRQVETLQRWNRKAQAVGYFDEEYPASQMWKAEWEAARGDELAARARRALDALEPLRTG